MVSEFMAVFRSALEKEVWQSLKKNNIRDKSVLLAVSGGLDSMVLLNVLHRLVNSCGLTLHVAHVHHGSSSNSKYRDDAFNFVRRSAKNLDLPFWSNLTATKQTPEPNPGIDGASGESEASLRKFRFDVLEGIRARKHIDLIGLAHHRDDLLETRLLRLIRGVGPQGIQAMKLKQKHLLRPLLFVNRAHIEVYADEFAIEFLSDPSNKDVRPLRNWLRHEWLPMLEAKRPGASETLSRSLGLLARRATVPALSMEDCVTEKGISRSRICELDREGRRQAVATYLLRLG